MRSTSIDASADSWIVDYSAARARAISWLGDRYLLARPINVRKGRWPGTTRVAASSANATVIKR